MQEWNWTPYQGESRHWLVEETMEHRAGPRTSLLRLWCRLMTSRLGLPRHETSKKKQTWNMSCDELWTMQIVPQVERSRRCCWHALRKKWRVIDRTALRRVNRREEQFKDEEMWDAERQAENGEGDISMRGRARGRERRREHARKPNREKQDKGNMTRKCVWESVCDNICNKRATEQESEGQQFREKKEKKLKTGHGSRRKGRVVEIETSERRRGYKTAFITQHVLWTDGGE